MDVTHDDNQRIANQRIAIRRLDGRRDPAGSLPMMGGVRQWLWTWLEWALLGFGVGCLGTFAYVTVDAHRFQQEQAEVFHRVSQASPPPLEATVAPGGLVGMLEVPRLKLSTAVISGDDDATLKRSAGHLPDTPLPWQPGNSALAAHRDGLFRPLKDVAVGDEILFRTVQEDLRYRVISTAIVQPHDLSVLEADEGTSSLTLITCYPFYYVGAAPKRFIVRAERLSGS